MVLFLVYPSGLVCGRFVWDGVSREVAEPEMGFPFVFALRYPNVNVYERVWRVQLLKTWWGEMVEERIQDEENKMMSFHGDRALTVGYFPTQPDIHVRVGNLANLRYFRTDMHMHTHIENRKHHFKTQQISS